MSKIMMNINKDKKVLICSAIGVVFSILGLIMYVVTTNNTGKYAESLIVAASLAGTVLTAAAALFIYMEGALCIVSTALHVFSALMFVSSQADNMGYALAGISDIGYGIQTTLIVGVIFYLLAAVGECIAVFGKAKELYSVHPVVDGEK